MNLIRCILFAEGSPWLGPPASSSAERHDAVFNIMLAVTGFFFLLVMVLMLWFVVRYRRRPGIEPPKAPTHNVPLELVWTAIPIGVVLTFFVLGFRAFADLDTPPPGAEVVGVTAQQWSFSFSYPNGATGEQLVLRVNRPVRLQLRSVDVLHSLYIPAFRIQRNAVPGRTTELWVQPTRPGKYPAYCTQYCGDQHSLMIAEVHVVEEAEYARRLAEMANIFVDPKTKAPLSYAAVGTRLYKSAGCAACHSVDAKKPNPSGPSWLGLYKRNEPFSEPAGFSLSETDDDAKWDAYLRESILDPGAKIVAGFQRGSMQSYAAQFSGTPNNEKKLKAIVEYIKSLDNHGPDGGPKYYRPLPTPAAEKPAEAKSDADGPSRNGKPRAAPKAD